MDKDNIKIKTYVQNNIPIQFKIYAISANDTINKNIDSIIVGKEDIIDTSLATDIFNLTKDIKFEALKYLKEYIKKTTLNASNQVVYNADNPRNRSIDPIKDKLITNFITEILNNSDIQSNELNEENFEKIKTAISEI